MLLESLYAPTVKDRRGGLNQRRFLESLSNSAASTTVNIITAPVVPGDTTRIITGIALRGLAGAAQIPLGVFANLQRAGIGIITARASVVGAAAASAFDYTFLMLNWIMLPGENITYQATFSAGGVANTVIGMAWGYDVPRGNVEG